MCNDAEKPSERAASNTYYATKSPSGKDSTRKTALDPVFAFGPGDFVRGNLNSYTKMYTSVMVLSEEASNTLKDSGWRLYEDGGIFGVIIGSTHSDSVGNVVEVSPRNYILVTRTRVSESNLIATAREKIAATSILLAELASKLGEIGR